MQKYIDYVNKFQEWNEFWLNFITNQLKKHLVDNQENQTEIEEILDFLYSTKKFYKTIWYKTILEKTKAWHKKLAKLESKDNEVEWIDYETIKDFWDWFKFVKLISQSAYNREWKLMSHCVASYFGRDVAIYSLRDEKNNPHCTIEADNQVKWKWNQTVDNKYFWYCIKFLEEMWFTVWENEMKNIWFYKLENIDKDLSVDNEYLYDWKYISDKNFDKVKDKFWEQYYWAWLVRLKWLIEIKSDFSFKINFDFKKLNTYICNFAKKITEWSENSTSGNESTASTSGYRSTASTSGNRSTASTSGNESTASTSGNESTASMSGDKSTASTSGDWSTASTSGDWSTASTSGDWSTASTSGYKSTASTSGDKSTASTSGYRSTASTSGYKSTASTSGYRSTASTSGYKSTASTSGDESTIIVNWKNNVWVANWYKTKWKWKIWNYICLTEYDEKWENIIDCKVIKIDWQNIKEDTFYILKNWEFVIYDED